MRRLALVAFAAVFVLLFIAFAVAQGIGSPSVPSGAVAIVEGVPSELGTVTDAEFEKALDQAAAQSGLKKTPQPGDAKYEEVVKTAMNSLFDAIWIQGEAEELGISPTPKEVQDQFEQIKEQNFKTAAEYQEFLKTSNFTQEDVDERVKLQLVGTQIQQQIGKEAPPPSSSQIEQYYEAAKESQFVTPESRDIRVLINSDKGKAEAAKAQLEKDDSPASWKKVATRYSTDAVTKKTGGLQAGVTEERLVGPLKKAVFGAPLSEVQGVAKTPNGYVVFEVVKVTASKVQPLEEAKPQISSQLAQQNQQETLAQFIANYTNKWQSQTFCAADYTIERCANYKGNGHPSGAPPTCYEAEPKGGLPGACPAPVQQLTPQIPGSASALEPQGQRPPQRPQPAGLKPESAAATPGVEGAVPGAVPGE